MISKVFHELRGYTYAEKCFVLLVMLCSVCITSEHAVTKPISYSVFVSYFSASYFPYAWLAMMPLNFLIVMLYNRFLPRIGCLNMTRVLVSVIVITNLICSFYLSKSPVLGFVQFIWKDIYVMLMFQQLWSVVHSTIDSKRAKYLYGVIYGVGGMRAILGSCIPGFLAIRVGSELLLIITCLIYLIFMFLYGQMLKIREGVNSHTPLPTKMDTKDTRGGFELIYQSKQLRFILMIVIFMQIASTFIDFEFNSFLEHLVPNKDLRTEYSGRVFGIIHIVNIFLQFFGAFIMMQFLGMRLSHLIIPVLFACNVVGFIVVPAFGVIAACFSMIKACDYSVFTILKEMLYLPLKVEEKFKAKSVIDVFAYRTSKGLASLIILSLQFLHCVSWIRWMLLLVFMAWFATVFYKFKKEHSYSY